MVGGLPPATPPKGVSPAGLASRRDRSLYGQPMNFSTGQIKARSVSTCSGNEHEGPLDRCPACCPLKKTWGMPGEALCAG